MENETNPSLIKIAVIAPAPALRLGLCSALAAGAGLEVIAEAADLSGLNSRFQRADVLVFAPSASHPLDLRGKEIDAPVLVLLDDPDIDRALLTELFTAPAWGILPTEATPEELHAAVYALDLGLIVSRPSALSPYLAGNGPDFSQFPPDELAETLTPRETEVLQLMGQGLTNKEIAARLILSEHTVKFHTSAIFSKLGVSNRTEAVRMGARAGLISL